MDNLVPEQTGNMIPGEGETHYDPLDAVTEMERIFDETMGETPETEDKEGQPSEAEATETETDETATESTESTETETDEEFIASLEELAEANETDLDTLLDLNVAIEGLDDPVPLKDLVAFRAEHHGALEGLKQDRAQFGEATREISARAQKLHEALQAEGHGYSEALKQLHQTFANQRESEEMRQLQASDPARWAAEDRKHEQAMKVIEQGYANARQQFMQTLGNARSQFREQQGQILAANIEGWGQEKAVEAAAVIQDEMGFGLEELTDPLDARLVSFALKHKAMAAELADLKGRVDAGEKAAKLVKGKTTPRKTLRTRAKQSVSGEKIIDLQSRLAKETASRGGLSFERSMDIANALLAEEA